ncbi:MAG: rhomboid family intramembrane serine protease [bacterium]|nr:rhomboid family intramembrane serine protease [bacterium]
MMNIKKWININTILIAINAIIFAVYTIIGSTTDIEFMYTHGAMYPEAVWGGEWYRIISAMFLHFGAEHLLSNLFMQYFLGDMLLRAVSQWQYLMIYLVAGIGGNLTSLFMMEMTGEYAVAAGASGAIYGVIGALLLVVLRSRGQFEGISVKRMLLAAALYIYYGFTTEGVDAWAHLGGLVVGLFVTMLFYHRAPVENEH